MLGQVTAALRLPCRTVHGLAGTPKGVPYDQEGDVVHVSIVEDGIHLALNHIAIRHCDLLAIEVLLQYGRSGERAAVAVPCAKQKGWCADWLTNFSFSTNKIEV